MNIRKSVVGAALVLVIALLAATGFPAETTGWIRAEKCWVHVKPGKEAKTAGIIRQKAAVTVEEANEGWFKIVFAPVRDAQTGNYLDLKEGYIEKGNVTNVDPCKW